MRGGVLVASAVACIGVACDSDKRDVFEATPDRPIPSATNKYPESDPGSTVCDGNRLAAARSLAGCHFITTELAYGADANGEARNWMPPGCYPILVSNVSSVPVHLRLRMRDREEDAARYSALATVIGRDVAYAPLRDGVLAPRETAVVSALFVPYRKKEAVPAGPSFCPTSAFDETGMAIARSETVSPSIELLTDAPVVATRVHAYGMQPRPVNGWKAQPPEVAFTIFPIHLWEASTIETGVFKPGLPPKLFNPDSHDGVNYETPVARVRSAVIASVDDTSAELPLIDGTTRKVTLSRGEAFSYEPNDSFVGQTLHSNKPIGIVTFAPEAYISWEFPIAFEPDAQRVYQPSMPSSLWGSEYVAARHGDRWNDMPERPPWRIIGGADDTLLTYEPYKPDGAPDRVRRGELAVFFADASFVVRSQDGQHPFYLSGHMTGAHFQKQRFGFRGFDQNLRGAPISVHQVATARWARQYPFYALPNYPENSLVVVRRKGGRDVRLDCAGPLTGWEPIGTTFEVARVPLTGHLFEPISYAAGTCQAGAHWIESDDPFTATLWAWGNNETTTQLDYGTFGAYAIPLFGTELPTSGTAH